MTSILLSQNDLVALQDSMAALLNLNRDFEPEVTGNILRVRSGPFDPK
jgi:hypothetical protein